MSKQFKRKKYEKPTSLEDAQKIILDMEEEFKQVSSIFEEHNTLVENNKSEKEKLESEISRLKNKNLEYFTRLEETFTTDNKDQKSDTQESEMTLDNVIDGLL